MLNILLIIINEIIWTPPRDVLLNLYKVNAI